MHFWVGKNRKKISLLFSLGIFLFSSIFSAVFPERALAFLGVGDIGSNIDITPAPTANQQLMFNTEKKVELSVDKAITASVMSSVIQGASYFMQKLAYDTAVYVANGGKGQSALVFKDGWGSYLEKVGGDAVGRAVQELGAIWGLDFCNFPNLDLQLYLELGIRQADLPTTECHWSDLKKAYGDKDFWNKGFWERQQKKLENFQDRFDSSDEVLKEFSKTLKVKNTDFGIALGAIAQVDGIKAKAGDAKTAERLEGSGFKPLTDILSGKIKTPGDTIRKETEALSAKERQDMSYTNLAGIYASGAIEIIPQAAGMFLNTLTNQLLQKLLTQGLVSGDTSSDVAYFSDFDPNYRNSLESVKNAYSFLFTRIPSQIIDYNIVAEYVSCPDNPGLNNCVMDSGLQDAISRATVDKPMTIREAMEEGYLNENWPLISPRRERDHFDIKGCVAEKYCYSNIQKLRKARILPLGFEIAALRSDPDKPWTLGDVVRGFDDCLRDLRDPSIIIPDPSKPFCHLINPNWVIKVPPARCKSLVIGDTLIDPQSSSRSEFCADLSTCLQTDDKGACIAYGYCTKEKNVWKIGADTCPAEYNTCTTYVNSQTKKVVSYLTKTVDYGECTVDDVGCRAYSLENLFIPNASSSLWRHSASIDPSLKWLGRNQVVFFNEKVEDVSKVCSANSDGCTAFYPAKQEADGRYFDPATSTDLIDFAINREIEPTHIRKAPDYMGCYDTDRALNGNQWPASISEILHNVSDNPACKNFASACIKEEVGCEAFTPLNSTTKRPDGPNVRTIPGKIGPANVCAEECLGYETFKQEPVQFDKAIFPTYFIPSQAESCPSSANGCSEFTNIDARGRGGEGLEYYTDLKYCEKPADDNSNIQTYYSWEGSANSGYVIRTHKLKPAADGSPDYVLDMADVLADFAAQCNEAVYNALLQHHADIEASDCKALFDDAGRTYYRLLSKTVSVDSQCHPLRKTEPVFVIDPNLQGQACTDKKGFWNVVSRECNRCINGGKYENGFCIYQTISAPGESTSCAPEYNGCRAYSGNGVGNIQDISFDDFEPGSENADSFAAVLEGWNTPNVRISAEATHQGLHSLEVTGNEGRATKSLATSTLNGGKWYEISFLARATGHTLTVSLSQGVNVSSFTPQALQVSNDWQLYRLGPIPFNGTSSSPAFVVFNRSTGNGSYFIDQVKVRELFDYEHYIKDSWKKKNGGQNVPLSCDSAPDDTLPGEALGCRAYADSNNNLRFATGFERLCRENAIGCAPVWNTHNTVSGEGADRPQAFNVLCTGLGDSTCRATVEGVEYGKCFIEPGKTSCYIDKIILPDGVSNWTLFVNRIPVAESNLSFTSSSVYLQQDTPDISPLFLAVGEKSKFSCSATQRGCTVVGLEEKLLPNQATTSFAFSELSVKNDPELYGDILCRDDLLGCSRFKSDGRETYFKDPQITGNSLCIYKKPSPTQSGPYGWFLQGVGKCENNLSILCRDGSQCGEGNRCIQQDTVACSPDNIQAGGFYDIWSNRTPEKYKGNVGVCTAEYNGCREIVDREDTSTVYPEGKPYYIIFNEKVEQKQKECTQVSLIEGCVLFDKTDEPNKVFDSAKTYERSEKRPDAPFGFVDPVKEGDPDFVAANSNILLKVNRDRECNEWLSCQNYVRISSSDNVPKFACQKLTACRKIGPGATSDCADVVGDMDSREDFNRAIAPLSHSSYIKRPISWYDPEFSGYSLYNKFQITNMSSVTFVINDNALLDINSEDLHQSLVDLSSKVYFVRELREDLMQNNDVDDPEGSDGILCSREPANTQQGNTDWESCGFDMGGMCFAGKCIYPLDGSFENRVDVNAQPLEKSKQILKAISELQGSSCKSVPSKESPFASSAIDTRVAQTSFVSVNGAAPADKAKRRPVLDLIDSLPNVNVCQSGDCSCSYTKVDYGVGVSDYWPTQKIQRRDSNGDEVSIPGGVCVGGPFNGYPCLNPDQCLGDNPDERGVCSLKQQETKLVGIEGFCLEYDLSRKKAYGNENHCLTWLPLDTSVSPVDIYHSSIEATYQPQTDAGNVGGAVMCLSASTVANAPIISLFDESPDGAGGYNTIDVNEMCNTGPTSYWDAVFNWQLSGVIKENSCTTIVTHNKETSNYDRHNERLVVQPANAAQPLTIFDYSNTIEHQMYKKAELPWFEGGFEAQKTMYNYLLKWAREKHHIPNPMVLRFEVDPNGKIDGPDNPDNIRDPFGWYLRFQQNGDIWNGTGAPYSLNPLIVPRDPKPEFEQVSAKAFMHPPRKDFLAGDRPVDYNRDTFIIVNPDAEEENETYRIGYYDTSMYGPEAAYMGDEARVDPRLKMLYVSPLEMVLNEQDLSKVFFVPMYAHDLREQVKSSGIPETFSSEHFIDFDRLNSPDPLNANHAFAKRVYDVNDTVNGDWEDDMGVQHKDAIVWTYMLKRCSNGWTQANGPCLENFRYVNYAAFVNVSNSDLSLNTDGTKNEIASRYVYYFGDWTPQDPPPEFLRNSISEQSPETHEIGEVTPPRPEHDVFTAPCSAGTEDEFFAIGMDFNADGDFLGYITKNCARPNVDAYGIQFGVVASMKDRCTSFVNVHNSEENGLEGDFNKAWTNRVWNNGIYLPHPYTQLNAIKRNTYNTPYGSLPLEGSRDKLEQGNIAELRKLSFARSTINNGIPYSCQMSYFGSWGRIPQPFCGSLAPPEIGVEFGSANSHGGWTPAIEMESQNAFSGIVDQIGQTSTSTAFDSIAQIFAKVYIWSEFVYTVSDDPFLPLVERAGTRVVKNISESVNSSLAPNGIDRGYDVRPVPDSGEFLMPPKVYATNPLRCDSFTNCSYGNNDNMTINGKNSVIFDFDGDGVLDEDVDDNNVADGIMGRGIVYGDIRFFGFADDNRMPIRRVTVDWGDGTDHGGGKMAFYKNHKAVCQMDNDALNDLKIGQCAKTVDGQLVPTGATCVENTERNISCASDETCIRHDQNTLSAPYQRLRFGSSLRACTEAYFEYIHPYTCGVDQIRAAKSGRPGDYVKKVSDPSLRGHANRLKQNYNLEDNDWVCVYAPRVQIMDNWGWCNGRCTKVYDADGQPVPGNENANVTEGCYSNFPRKQQDVNGDGVFEPILKDLNGDGKILSSEYETMDQCEVTANKAAGISPWSDYDGLIIVVPDTQ